MTILTDKALQSAMDNFWGELASHYPQITSGDFPPDAISEFEAACRLAASRWLESNKPSGPLAVLRALGFEEISTAGGCTALCFERPDGERCLVTNDASSPRVGEDWDVGFYNDKGDYMDGGWPGGGIISYHTPQLLAALALIAEWRVG